jgi:hypothetical protein
VVANLFLSLFFRYHSLRITYFSLYSRATMALMGLDMHEIYLPFPLV